MSTWKRRLLLGLVGMIVVLLVVAGGVVLYVDNKLKAWSDEEDAQAVSGMAWSPPPAPPSAPSTTDRVSAAIKALPESSPGRSPIVAQSVEKIREGLEACARCQPNAQLLGAEDGGTRRGYDGQPLEAITCCQWSFTRDSTQSLPGVPQAIETLVEARAWDELHELGSALDPALGWLFPRYTFFSGDKLIGLALKLELERSGRTGSSSCGHGAVKLRSAEAPHPESEPFVEVLEARPWAMHAVWVGKLDGDRELDLITNDLRLWIGCGGAMFMPQKLAFRQKGSVHRLRVDGAHRSGSGWARIELLDYDELIHMLEFSRGSYREIGTRPWEQSDGVHRWGTPEDAPPPPWMRGG